MPITPTRSTLLKLNRTIKLAVSGHSLLKRKRDGLIQEFFKVFNQAKDAKSQLQENYMGARTAIALARAVDGSSTVRSAAFAHKEPADIQFETKNVMGVTVPKIQSQFEVSAFNTRGYGVIGTSGYIDDAAESYEKVLKSIIVAAEIETTLRKLLMEIDKTKRRVNALEFRTIPSMKKDAKYVKQRLEEMEREDVFRLKRIKGKKGKAK
ncbi:V-type ATP synthase subunit D [archaeon]|nr:MAG: V-type ATP synthase subunit D [archaeon]